MQYLVAAIDDPAREQIDDIAGEIVAVTGKKALARTRRPHIVLQAAERYAEGIFAALDRIAAATQPFDVMAGRIGVFRAQTDVVAIEVIRSPQLDRLHDDLWRATTPLADRRKDVYAPATWAPHVAIATGELSDDEIALVQTLLARRPPVERIAVTNVCLVPHDRAYEWRRFDFVARSLRS